MRSDANNLNQAVRRRTQQEVFAIARKALTDLADATGGLAYFPEAVEDTEAICTEIAHDIRNQYTLAYYPTHFERDGTFRTVQVAVTNPFSLGANCRDFVR